MPMQLLDNKAIYLELFPEQSGQPAAQQDPAALGAKPAKLGEASSKQDADDNVNSVANVAKRRAEKLQKQAADAGQNWSDSAQQKGANLQQQAGQYQSQASESVKGYGESGEKAGQAYVKQGTDAAHAAAKERLPEEAQSYAGAAVDYGANFATGTVGTVAGGVKDVGDTLGNAGYETVAGLGKVGYNLGSGLGSAVMGKKKPKPEPERPAVEQEVEATEEKPSDAAT